MNPTRRKWLTLSAAWLVGCTSRVRAEYTDGSGPNRGIAERGRRGKQTCVNTSVHLSDISNRITTPDDFGSNSCEMLADSFEGPYFTCSPSVGKDIAIGQPGKSLTIALRLIDKYCQPVSDGVIDVWACNAEGYYSGYSNDPDKIPPMIRAIVFGHIKPDTNDRFCRGALRTDADGIAEFNTVYPGYYYGQPIHVHFKAHVNGTNLMTSQANFPEQTNQKIMQSAPYNAQRPIKRNTGKTKFPTMQVIEKEQQLIATLDLIVPA